MQINGVPIEDRQAEAFGMWAVRLLISAIDLSWALTAAREATGCATSIIGCDAEAGIERQGFFEADDIHDALEDRLGTAADGRPTVPVLLFARHLDDLTDAITRRVGQCVMTCPTTALFDGLDAVDAAQERVSIEVGRNISAFGDGYESQVDIAGRPCWRIPVMDGVFVVQQSVTAVRAVGGGQFLILGRDPVATLRAAQRAAVAIRRQSGVIAPFPGGVVRCGSKVGSQKYPGMIASTNEPYCPTLRDREQTRLPPDGHCVYEIVIDGLDRDAVAAAMRVGIHAACEEPEGLVGVSACDFGGKLGTIRFGLHVVLSTS